MTQEEESLLRAWHERQASSERSKWFRELSKTASDGTRRSGNLNLQKMLRNEHWLALKAARIHARICADLSYTFGHGLDDLAECFSIIRDKISRLLEKGLPDVGGISVMGLSHDESKAQEELLRGLFGDGASGMMSPQDVPKAIGVLGSNIRQWGAELVHFDVAGLSLKHAPPCPNPQVMHPYSVLRVMDFVFWPLANFQKRVQLYRSALLELAQALTGRRTRSNAALVRASRDLPKLLEEVWSMVDAECSSSVPPFEELRQEFMAVKKSVQERLDDHAPLLVPRYDAVESPCADDDVVLLIPLGKFVLEGNNDVFRTPPLYLVWIPGHFPFVTPRNHPRQITSFPNDDLVREMWNTHTETLHPHVASDGRICFGDSAPAFEVVRRGCCLSVALDMVRTALGTYRAGSAYFQFDREDDHGDDGVSCARCDHYGHVDDFYYFDDDHPYCEGCSEVVGVFSNYEGRVIFRFDAFQLGHGPHEGDWISTRLLDEYLADHPKPQDEETHEPDAQGEAQAAASVQSPHDYDSVQGGNQAQAPQATPSEDVPTPDIDPVQFNQRLVELERLYGPHHQIILDFVLQSLHRGVRDGHAPSPLVGQAAPPADDADAPVHCEVVGEAPLSA